MRTLQDCSRIGPPDGHAETFKEMGKDHARRLLSDERFAFCKLRYGLKPRGAPSARCLSDHRDKADALRRANISSIEERTLRILIRSGCCPRRPGSYGYYLSPLRRCYSEVECCRDASIPRGDVNVRRAAQVWSPVWVVRPWRQKALVQYSRKMLLYTKG